MALDPHHGTEDVGEPPETPTGAPGTRGDPQPGVHVQAPPESYRTLCLPDDALAVARQPAEGFGSDVWVAGGAEIYKAFLQNAHLVDVLDMTLVPDAEIPDGATVTYMPPIPFERFCLVEETRNEADPRLLHRVYRRAEECT